MKKLILFTLLIISILSFYTNLSYSKTLIDINTIIPHAGGEIYNYYNTNSLEALNNSYTLGFRIIELDFDWTIDNYPVCIHDWTETSKRLFCDSPKQYSLHEFLTKPTFNNLTLLDLNRLSQWLLVHDDVFIISDIKNDNIKLLYYVKENYPNIHKHLIPQIYSLSEYSIIESMGYSNIILTLYKNNFDHTKLLQFASTNKLYAITMPQEIAFTNLPKKLKSLDIPIFVHTINSVNIYKELLNRNIYGVYSDCLNL